MRVGFHDLCESRHEITRSFFNRSTTQIRAFMVGKPLKIIITILFSWKMRVAAACFIPFCRIGSEYKTRYLSGFPAISQTHFTAGRSGEKNALKTLHCEHCFPRIKWLAGNRIVQVSLVHVELLAQSPQLFCRKWCSRPFLAVIAAAAASFRLPDSRACQCWRIPFGF